MPSQIQERGSGSSYDSSEYEFLLWPELLQVLNEFTHGKREAVTKSDFKEVLSDILLGMAAGLQRDPVVILRIDGEDLREFVDGLRFEPEAIAIFSEINPENVPLRKSIAMALEQLGVGHGMPPLSDSWVIRGDHGRLLVHRSCNQHPSVDVSD